MLRVQPCKCKFSTLSGRYTAITFGLICLLSAPGATGNLRAENSFDVSQRINAANALLRQGDVEQALETYQQIASTTAGDDRLNYNLAVAHYQQGDLDAAARLFGASANSADAMVASRSRYNLGNCHYANALKSAEKDRPTAISELKQAIAHYRSALRGNPQSADARANIELANELLRKLAQEEEQQQNPEKSSEKNPEKNPPHSQKQDKQDPSEKSQGQQNSQESGSQKSNESDTESQQSQKEPQANADQQRKSGEAGQQPQDATEDEKEISNQEKSDSNQANSPESDDSQGGKGEQSKTDQQSTKKSSQPTEQQNQDERQRTEQQESTQADSESDPAKQQPTATGELSTANLMDEDLKAGKDSSESVHPKNALMTREEAMKMLQAVRDRDMLRRLQLEKQQRSRRITVDKDW